MRYFLDWHVLMTLCVIGLVTACDQNGSNAEAEEESLMDPERIAELVAMGKGHPPVTHFFQNPKMTGFKISPDGKYMAYRGPYKHRLNVYVREVGTSEDDAVRITADTSRDIRAYFWANPDRIVYFQDSAGNENFHVYAVNKDGTDLDSLTPFPGVQARLIDRLRDIPDEMIIGLNKENKQLHEPYRLNIVTGELEKVAENQNQFEPIVSWITDHDGKLRAAMKMTDGVNQNLMYRDTEDDTFRTILTTNFRVSVSPVMFTFDNKHFYALSNMDRDKTALVKLNAQTGEEMEHLFEHPEYDISGLNYSRKRKVLTDVSYTSWKRQRHFFDRETAKLYQRLERDLGDYEVVITSKDDAEKRFVVRTYSDRSLGAYYFYDKQIDELRKLADVNPDIKEDEMAPMKPITYETRDGLTIHGYLTIPPGKEAQNLPVVVHPHGGPWARDNWGFNSQVQFLASRGYAVFQMNFRGSTGYGREFWEASFKEWGRKMQEDITDGVHWLIEEGIADPDRIAIYGASYGGYATLAGVTYTPDLYTCAIDYVGVSNLFTFIASMPAYWEPLKEMFYEMVGDPKEDSLQMASYSPALNADKIKTPLFIAQGALDPRVVKDESDQMVKALRERGVDVPYMVKDNEGHGFSNEENRYEFYRAMAGFLKLHMPAEETSGKVS